MPIEFEAPKPIMQAQFMLKTVGEEMIRPKSRYYDENEHEIPWDYIEFMHAAMKAMGGSSLAPRENGNDREKEDQEKRPPWNRSSSQTGRSRPRLPRLRRIW